MPGRDSMISAWGCARKVVVIRASSSEIRDPMARSWAARSATMLAATSCPGTTVCWALAAARAAGRDLVGAADLPLDQPCPQPRLTGPADRLRGLVAGQQGQRAAAVGVVERPLQRREVATEHVAEPVDHANPVTDQVGAMGHQQPQFGHQRGGDLHLLQIAAVSQRLGDDVGVAGVGLGFTAVGAGHLVHGSAGHVPDPLTVRCQQRQQQPRHGAGHVDSPDDFLGAGQHARRPRRGWRPRR